MTTPAAYPHDLERWTRLRDGTPVFIRPIRAEDAPRLIETYDRLSRHTAYQRFFTVLRRLPPDWARILAEVDYQRRLALVAEHETPHGVELIGVGRWEPTETPDTVEVAFVVEDGWQGKGLGTILVSELLAAATRRGIRRFQAYVLADNRRMLELLTRLVAVHSRTVESGVVALEFTTRAESASRPGA
jgi:RimJ/RimL family protein N-acetyltransferase